LLPPILFSVAAAYVFLKASLFYNQPAGALTRSSWLAASWQFAPDLAGMLKESFFGALFLHQATYNNVLWTMSFEFYGSLIVFGFLYFFRNSPRRWIVYLFLVLFFRRTYYLAFVLGVLLCDWQSREDNFLEKAGTKMLLAALGLGLFAGSVPNERPLAGTMYALFDGLARPRTWHIVGAFLVMASVLRLRSVQAVLSRKPFVFLGRVSFSLYILHFLMIASLACYLQTVLVQRLSYHQAFLAGFGISLPLILAASYYTYIYVDRTGIRLSQAVYGLLLGKKTRERTKQPLAAPADETIAVAGDRNN
jgi:peptidoglycan/LPS O-acetylase OafA/YrhL